MIQTYWPRSRFITFSIPFVFVVLSCVWAFRALERIELKNWLDSSAVPIVSLSPEFPNTDFSALRSVFTHARIIGLGEATHGSREFFLAKHRLARFLVEELNYTVFALEASYASCAVVNDYILHGKGSAENAVQALDLWMWETEEVKEMIEWMRLYNMRASATKKLRFVGFDVQTHASSYSKLFDFFHAVAPNRLPALSLWLQEFRAVELDFRTVRESYSRKKFDALRRSIFAELHFLETNRAVLLKKTSNDALVDAALRLQTMSQFLVLVSAMLDTPENPMTAGVAIRDSAMTVNLQTIMHGLYPNEKVVFWSHNGHVGNGDITSIPSMGRRLKALYGDAYYAIGFEFKEGAFQARDKERMALQRFAVSLPLNVESASLRFSESRYENFFIDFRQPDKGFFVDHWIQEQHVVNQIGGVFSEREPRENWLKAVTFGETFDGLVFLSYTTPTHLLSER